MFYIWYGADNFRRKLLTLKYIVYCYAFICTNKFGSFQCRLFCKHESISEFQKKYSKHVERKFLLSQKDVGNVEDLRLYPIYMLPFILEDLQ